MLLTDGNKCFENFMMCLRFLSFYFKFDRIGLDHELKFYTSCSNTEWEMILPRQN